MRIYLDECIWIEVITVRMGNIDRIDRLHLLSIKSDFHCALHKISKCIIRKPCINENSDIFSSIIRYVDKEFGMSKWCDNHRVFLLRKRGKAIIDRFFISIIILGKTYFYIFSFLSILTLMKIISHTPKKHQEISYDPSNIRFTLTCQSGLESLVRRESEKI